MEWRIKLPNGSYSISIFNIFFEYIYIYIYIYIYKHGEMTVNPSIRIYTNKTKNRITFKIKTGYYLELLTPQVQWNYLEALKDTKKW